MAMPNIQLTNNLKYLRKSRKLNQDELGRTLNISRQAYSNYENNKRTPDLDTLMSLSKYYQVTLDQLVNYDLSNEPSSISENQVPYFLSIDIDTGNTIYLTKEETELITKFRSLSDDTKQILYGFLDSTSKK